VCRRCSLVDVTGSVLNSGRSDVNTPKKFEPLCPNFKTWTSRGGCFQWRLFVCPFVCLSACLFVNFVSRTIKCRMLKLGGALCKNLGQVRLSGLKVRGQGHWGQKKEKVQHFVPELSSGAQSSCGSFFFGSGPRGCGYAGGKISECCLPLCV